MAATLASGAETFSTEEFRLVAACAVWPPGEERNAGITRAAAMVRDWPRVLRTARRQRVVGLVHDGLKRAQIDGPSETLAAIRDTAQQQLRDGLSFAAEAIRLSRAFGEEGIRATFFKGVVSALNIYNDVGIRHCKDIDILVGRHDMEKAGATLEALGYDRVFPPPGIGEARLRALMRTGKDLIYRHRENPLLEVELHWRLFNNAKFMTGIGVAPVEKTFPALDNARLSVFSPEDEFAYLCAHGAAFAWCRLKWLADIAALINTRGPENLARSYRHAVALGARRPAAQALLLCRRLLSTSIPDSLCEEFDSDAAVRRLEALAVEAMTQGDAEIEPYDLPDGMRPIERSLWALGGSASYLMGEINSRWISPDDVVNVPLPRGLTFGYPLLRLPLWIARRFSGRSI